MKKLLILLLATMMIASFTNSLFAAYPSSVTVDSYLNGCLDYNQCVSDPGIGYQSNVLTHSFDSGVYTFTVDTAAGAWSSYNSPDTQSQWLDRHWFWSLYIYNPQTSTLYGNPGPTLGSNSDFLSENNALAQFNSSNNNVTVDMGTGGDLWFYIKDRNPRDNIGSVAVNVAVVPEPVSSSLFVIGGAVFAGRRFWKKRSK